VIEAHERGITDINWHARDPNFMATTSIDGSVKGWDIRVKDSDRAVMRLADWGDAATQVKWNRQHDHILASSHDNRLCIWDTRVSANFLVLQKGLAHASRW
jgi:WD40 repeat protein